MAHAHGSDSEHLISLSEDWDLWRDFAVRSAGFPVQGLEAFGPGDESGRLADVARGRAFREAVAWQSREALRSAVHKVAAGTRESPARLKRREEVVASYWQRYCSKNDTIGFFGPLAWGRFEEDVPGASVRAGAPVAARRVHLEVWAVEAVARAAGADVVLPMSPDPERDLRVRLAALPDPQVRERATAALDRLEAVRDELATAEGDAVLATMTELDGVFEELSGREAKRGEGDSDGGRTVAYLDCMRDLDMTLGAKVLGELAASLPPLLASSRWWCGIAHSIGRVRLGEIAAARGDGPLLPMLGDLMRTAWGIRAGLNERASELQGRWDKLLGADDDATLASRAVRAFSDYEPAWPLSVYYSADIQIAAEEIAGIDGGDFLIVLGDFHGGSNPLGQGIFVRRHPDPDRFRNWIDEDVGGRPVVFPPLGGPFPMTARMYPAVGLGLVGPGQEAPADVPAVDLRELDVVDGDVRDRAGSFSLALADFFWLPLYLCSMQTFDPFGGRGSERVTLGRTVVRRARWSCRAEEFPLDPDAVAAWATENGLPRRVFVRSPLERKPVYIDLESPVLLRFLARFAGAAAERAPTGSIEVSEMLPAPDQCWLEDSGGRYTSEMRIVAVDARERAGRGHESRAAASAP